jgi:copper chaperone
MSTNQSLQVTGMTCQHCVKAVREALLNVDGVTGADVDLDSGQADVQGDADRSALVAAVKTAGYGVAED